MHSLTMSPRVHQQFYGIDFPHSFLCVISSVLSSFLFCIPPRKLGFIDPALLFTPTTVSAFRAKCLEDREKRTMGICPTFWYYCSSDQRRTFPSLTVLGVWGPLCHHGLPGHLFTVPETWNTALMPTSPLSTPSPFPPHQGQAGLFWSLNKMVSSPLVWWCFQS